MTGVKLYLSKIRACHEVFSKPNSGRRGYLDIYHQLLKKMMCEKLRLHAASWGEKVVQASVTRSSASIFSISSSPEQNVLLDLKHS